MYQMIKKFGYIDSGDDMNLLRKQGKKLNWKYEYHLNSLGNEFIAEGIFDWIEKQINYKYV